jgi:hypothetical protein
MSVHQQRPSGDTQYLWDGGGVVDQDVAQIERALRPLRYRPSPPSEIQPGRMPSLRARTTWIRAAAALALTIGGMAAVSLFSTSFEDVGLIKSSRNQAAGAWSVVALQGSPRVGGNSIEDRGQLLEGDWIETDERAIAEIQVGDIGQVTVKPGSRLQVVAAREREHRMQLVRGQIDAFISAPPRLFLVDTPAATAVDLGCSYTLEVDDGGMCLLRVTLGWVSLEWGGRQAIVPRNAECSTRPGVGPGTPILNDAPTVLREAVVELDFGAGGAAAIEVVLATARDRDSLTLWHLMIHERDEQHRTRLVDRLLAIEPLPAGISRAEVMHGDIAALARWRSEFAWSPPE